MGRNLTLTASQLEAHKPELTRAAGCVARESERLNNPTSAGEEALQPAVTTKRSGMPCVQIKKGRLAMYATSILG